jgi:hypothetical protein
MEKEKREPEKVLDFQLLFEAVERGDINYLRMTLDTPGACDVRVFFVPHSS